MPGSQRKKGEDKMAARATYASGVFVLTPTESKRLIAKGVVRMPEVQAALENGRVIVATGSTNSYIAEEILGPVFPKEEFITGRVIDGKFGTTGGPTRLQPFVLYKGKKVDIPWLEAIKEFEADDVFIKGANAVDPEGFAGVLLGSPTGGTIGAALGVVTARGSHLIMPVGLEKLIPSVLDAANAFHGIKRITYTLDDHPVGFMPVVNATVVTEIQALSNLFSVEVTHIASGGIAGSEGSVTLMVEGMEDEVKRCMDLVRSIKGEPPFGRPS